MKESGSRWSIVSWRLWIVAPPCGFNLAKVQEGTPTPAKLVESEE